MSERERQIDRVVCVCVCVTVYERQRGLWRHLNLIEEKSKVCTSKRLAEKWYIIIDEVS